jgi:hypothetical protein
MEQLGTATCPVGWDHDLDGVFSGRALREVAEIQRAGFAQLDFAPTCLARSLGEGRRESPIVELTLLASISSRLSFVCVAVSETLKQLPYEQ